jgi:hypothetical protein
MQDAVRQVFGPSAGKSVSETANGVVAVTMRALRLSTIATIGVVVLAKAARAKRQRDAAYRQH